MSKSKRPRPMRLALGSKKGAPETPKDTIEKARLMYMSRDYTLEQIAQSCGVTTRTIHNLKKRYGWQKELERAEKDMDLIANLQKNKANATSEEEVAMRSNFLKMGNTLMACLSDHVVVKKNGKIVDRKKNIPPKDLKTLTQIYKDLQHCLFNALGANEKRELEDTDHMRIVQLMIKVINDEIPDPNVRKRIQAKFVELDEEMNDE